MLQLQSMSCCGAQGFGARRHRQYLLVQYPSGSHLSCCVHKPPKVYTFGFIVGDIIPKSGYEVAPLKEPPKEALKEFLREP